MNFLDRHPPVGLDSLKGQRPEVASLKLGPQVAISWTRSSIPESVSEVLKIFLQDSRHSQMIPYLPSCFSMTALSVMGIREPSTLTYPRL